MCVASQAHWPRHVLLRSSIIYGPQSPVPVARPLFLQFVVQQLAEQKETTFFQDEYRSPVYVADIVDILFKLVLQKQELPRRCALPSIDVPVMHIFHPGRLERRPLCHYCVVHGMLVRVQCSTKVVNTA